MSVQFVETRSGRQFVDVLLEQAGAAYANGELSRREYRRMKIACWLRPRKMSEVAEMVLDRAVEAGAMKPEAARDPCAVDWQAIADFIRTIMPIILEFISGLMILFA